MTIKDSQVAIARTELCRFLSACFYEPCIEFQEERLFDSMVDIAGRIDSDFDERARELRDAFERESLEDLLVDYTRLFLGPLAALAVPYESHWASKEDTSESLEPGILELYAEGGFEIDEGLQDRPDHIAIELEFLYALNFTSISAGDVKSRTEAGEVSAVRERLLREHLCIWAPQFLSAVGASAKTDFYRMLASLTREFLASEVVDSAPD